MDWEFTSDSGSKPSEAAAMAWAGHKNPNISSSHREYLKPKREESYRLFARDIKPFFVALFRDVLPLESPVRKRD